MNVQDWKAAEAKAIEGLAGAARKAAKQAFYEANKAAIRAAHDSVAIAATAARNAPIAAIEKAAADKGLRAIVTANVGIVRGSSWDSVILVCGNTFACKETLKTHGAVWNNAHKSWVFASTEAFLGAMAAI